MRNYLNKLYDARYFWMHLARIELKNKFRRSKLGILWTFVSPLCLTAIMSVVFAVAFHIEITTYAPYVLSGILVWELITSSFLGGSGVIIANDAYIRQFNHPISIYTLKSAIVYISSFLISIVSLFLWVLFVHPTHVVIGLFSLPLTAILLFLLAWGGTTIAAYTNTKYRDYPQMIPLILQAFWYVSPVFFQREMFEGHPWLAKWFQINPITHVLELIRRPFLEGGLPSPVNYLMTALMVLVICLAAVRINRSNEKDIIFYI